MRLRHSLGGKAGGRVWAADAYQDGGRVQARQFVQRPQHRHPRYRPNRRSCCARRAFKPPSGPPLVRNRGSRDSAWAGPRGGRGRAFLKEPLPPFPRGGSTAGSRHIGCCLRDKTFISRLGERRYSVIQLFIFIHSCSFKVLLIPSKPVPHTSSPSQLIPSLQLQRTKSWVILDSSSPHLTINL